MEPQYAATLEFWDISINRVPYRMARGAMYAKPTANTVRASLYFPRMEPRPALIAGNRIRIAACCANRRWMRDIAAEVKHVTDYPDGRQTVDVLMYRKGGEPAWAREEKRP